MLRLHPHVDTQPRLPLTDEALTPGHQAKPTDTHCSWGPDRRLQTRFTGPGRTAPCQTAHSPNPAPRTPGSSGAGAPSMSTNVLESSLKVTIMAKTQPGSCLQPPCRRGEACQPGPREEAKRFATQHARGLSSGSRLPRLAAPGRSTSPLAPKPFHKLNSIYLCFEQK